MLSVLMPAYNAEKFIEAAVYSVLDQTFRNFELLVVDDCSTDSTASLLSRITDPRLRVLRNGTNLGIVGSSNRAAAEARGSYIARIDADDLAFPTRFARQIDFLERNSEVSLLGTATFNLEAGRINPGRRFDDADPIFIRWLMYLSNPIVHSSVMFRKDLLDKTQDYLIEDFRYTEDFEFAHRVLKIGEIAALPERLVIYRLHEENATRQHREEMIERAGWVLARAYADLLGREATIEAALIARYVMAKDPVRDEATLHALGALIEALVASFIERYHVGTARRETIVTHACRIWWDIVRLAARSGYVGAMAKYHGEFRLAARKKVPLADAAASVVLGLIPARKGLAPLVRRFRTWKAPHGPLANGRPVRVEGVDYCPVALPRDEPPRLFVVVDTEAEFDWNGPFSRNQTRRRKARKPSSTVSACGRFTSSTIRWPRSRVAMSRCAGSWRGVDVRSALIFTPGRTRRSRKTSPR
jgi:glycosyltransferase involved in cell wall biosynthesis